MKAVILILCVMGGALPAAAKHLEFHPQRVLSQIIGASDNGIAVMPIGGMLAGIPLRRQSNIVVIETAKARITLSEVGRHFIVLPVNGTVPCARDGKWIVILDSDKKKHKFAIVHVEMLEAK